LRWRGTNNNPIAFAVGELQKSVAYGATNEVDVHFFKFLVDGLKHMEHTLAELDIDI
jgi:hypothetical protein